MKTLSTGIKIRAKPEKVWDILTKFSDYEEWNPVMTRIIGEASLGKKIEVHIHTIKGKNRIYHPTITKFDINNELRWQGRSFLPGIFEGERIFEIKGYLFGRNFFYSFGSFQRYWGETNG